MTPHWFRERHVHPTTLLGPVGVLDVKTLPSSNHVGQAEAEQLQQANRGNRFNNELITRYFTIGQSIALSMFETSGAFSLHFLGLYNA